MSEEPMVIGISEKKLYADAYDACYFGGEYDDQYCEGCPYKDNCSGYDDEDPE